MELGVQALVLTGDVQHAVALGLPADVHGHLGVEGPVVLVELLGGALLINTGHVRAGDVVHAAVGQDDVGSGGGGVHSGGGDIVVRLLVVIGDEVGVALIDVVEDHRRGHGAGDVHPVQDERDHRGGVGLGVIA